jgi:anti-sigma regulatory factor (Ser/Thr protein kinase)
MQTWRRDLSGSLPEIAATAQWIDELASELRLPTDKAYALRVCVEELLTNIFRHGGAGTRKIKMILALLPQRIKLVVEDDGKPFVVSTSIPRRVDHPIEKAQPGGLGIQLIHSFADRLGYQRAGLGNRATIEIQLLPKAQVARRSA